jgi:hypothetical protein
LGGLDDASWGEQGIKDREFWDIGGEGKGIKERSQFGRCPPTTAMAGGIEPIMGMGCELLQGIYNRSLGLV